MARLVVLLLLFAGPAFAAPDCLDPVRMERQAMGSVLRVVVCPLDDSAQARTQAARATDAVAQQFQRLEALWSTWVPHSDVSRLNAAPPGTAVAVAPETAAILARALLGSRQTDGLFDVTFAPLGALWAFDTPPSAHQPTKLQRVPTVAEVRAKMAVVGFAGLHVDVAQHTATLLRTGMAVHLGGIGKGAAVDAGVALLRQRGFADFAVQAGGDLYVAGRKGGRPWRVGIAHPRQPGQILGEVELADAAFSTSGDYERFAIIDGTRYHHILDPRTGWPATASQSATVRAATATDAEVLTKAAFIAGGASGVAMAEQWGAQAVIVDKDGTVWQSKGLVLR